MARKKKKSGLVDEPKPQRKPHIVWYDQNGVEIGDDGYSMTRIRTRMHRLFNALFIWAIVAVLIGIFCTVFAYAQNQEFFLVGNLDVEMRGGTQLNGFDFAFLLRIEGLLCLFTALLSFCANFIGFNWMYDRRSPRAIAAILGIIGIGSMAYEAAALLIVHVPDPVSVVNIVLVALVFTTMSAVESERPTLKKAKRVTKVIKKK